MDPGTIRVSDRALRMSKSPTDFIALSPPSLGPQELEAVKNVFNSGRLVQGPLVESFEERIAKRCGRKFAVAVSSGTSALQLALQALGIGQGDEVICPALSWPSPAHAIVLAGATAVIVDVDAEQWNLDPTAITAARGPKTRAAIVIDQFGMPARWAELKSALHGLLVIEDAACAIGSTAADGPCGSFGTLSILSFHPRKVLTTAEGGMCLTDDSDLAEHLRILRNHGQRSPGSFVWAAGNHRLSEIAAAIGLVQLDRLDDMLSNRQHLAARYRDALPELQWQKAPEGATSNAQTMGVVVSEHRDSIIQGLRQQNIESGALSYEISGLASVAPYARVPKATSHAKHIASHGLALPLHSEMGIDAQDRVIRALHDLCKKP